MPIVHDPIFMTEKHHGCTVGNHALHMPLFDFCIIIRVIVVTTLNQHTVRSQNLPWIYDKMGRYFKMVLLASWKDAYRSSGGILIHRMCVLRMSASSSVPLNPAYDL